MPKLEFQDSDENPRKKSKYAFSFLWRGGLCPHNPCKRILQPDAVQDVFFTPKEMEAVKYPKLAARVSEFFQHKFKHAG